MATLQERNGSFRVLFCYNGKRETLTIGRVSRQEAEATSTQVDYLLMRIVQRFLAVPPGVDIVAFIGGVPGQLNHGEGCDVGWMAFSAPIP